MNENDEILSNLQKEHKFDLKIERLKQKSIENHIDNFDEIVNKCNNNIKCIEENINEMIEANIYNFEKNQEKKMKLNKNH